MHIRMVNGPLPMHRQRRVQPDGRFICSRRGVLRVRPSQPQSAWGYIRPMIEENNGWAVFITTPRGRNHALDMAKFAQAAMTGSTRY